MNGHAQVHRLESFCVSYPFKMFVYIYPHYIPPSLSLGRGPLISHTIGDRVTSFYPTDYSREEPFTHTQNRYFFICFYDYFCITSVLPCEPHRPRKIDPNTEYREARARSQSPSYSLTLSFNAFYGPFRATEQFL